MLDNKYAYDVVIGELERRRDELNATIQVLKDTCLEIAEDEDVSYDRELSDDIISYLHSEIEPLSSDDICNALRESGNQKVNPQIVSALLHYRSKQVGDIKLTNYETWEVDHDWAPDPE